MWQCGISIMIALLMHMLGACGCLDFKCLAYKRSNHLLYHTLNLTVGYISMSTYVQYNASGVEGLKKPHSILFQAEHPGIYPQILGCSVHIGLRMYMTMYVYVFVHVYAYVYA